jgi:hypothetical protein
MHMRVRKLHKLFEPDFKGIVQTTVRHGTEKRLVTLARYGSADRQGRLIQNKPPHRRTQSGTHGTNRAVRMAHKVRVTPRSRKHCKHIVVFTANGIGGSADLASSMATTIHQKARKLA